MQQKNEIVAPSGSDHSTFFSRLVQHDAARKGLAAAVAGVVVAAVSELIWPSTRT